MEPWKQNQDNLSEQSEKFGPLFWGCFGDLLGMICKTTQFMWRC